MPYGLLQIHTNWKYMPKIAQITITEETAIFATPAACMEWHMDKGFKHNKELLFYDILGEPYMMVFFSNPNTEGWIMIPEKDYCFIDVVDLIQPEIK